MLVVLALVALVALFVAVRVLRTERKPDESDRFRAATELTSAWSRGEAWPPAYPDEPSAEKQAPAGQPTDEQAPAGQPTDEQGLSRSSRT